MRKVDRHRIRRSGFSVHVHHFNGERFGEHSHEYLEILVVVNDGGRHFVDGAEHALKRGDIYLVGPYHSHAAERSDSGKPDYFNIEFTPDILGTAGSGEILTPFYDMRSGPISVGSDLAQCETLATLMLRELSSQAVYREQVIAHLLSALLMLVIRHRTEGTSFTPAVLASLIYINDRFRDDITNEMMAEEVGLSPARLSQVFKHATGMTVKTMLTHRRLTEAKQLLIYTSRGIIDLMHDAGFNDLSYFNRVFKKAAGMSPSAYRERFGTPEDP
ncbi:MAG: AraC family transcriptional regulator [Spirochaetota bacterium]